MAAARLPNLRDGLRALCFFQFLFPTSFGFLEQCANSHQESNKLANDYNIWVVFGEDIDSPIITFRIRYVVSQIRISMHEEQLSSGIDALSVFPFQVFNVATTRIQPLVPMVYVNLYKCSTSEPNLPLTLSQ